MIFTNELGEKYEGGQGQDGAYLIRPYKKPDKRKKITVKAELIKRDESEYVSDFVGLQFDSRCNVVWIKEEVRNE